MSASFSMSPSSTICTTTMPGSHDHDAPRAGARHFRPLLAAFCLVVIFMAVEIVAGFVTGSLALLSDAGHMASDALGLGMALAAIAAASKTQVGGRHTYGLYRLEILAALANAILLFGVAIYVLIEAVRRLGEPPEVLSGTMLVVALLGLAVNLVAWRLLRSGASESINLEGAYLEVLADLVGSIGVSRRLSTVTRRSARADPLRRLEPCRSDLRCGDRGIHPPPRLATRQKITAHPAASRPGAAGHEPTLWTTQQHPRRYRCSRSARVDSHV